MKLDDDVEDYEKLTGKAKEKFEKWRKDID